MATSKALMKALDRVAELKADLKEANADLKEAVEETAMYKAFLTAIKETSEDKIPEKAASANAFKITLAMLTKKEEADAD
jgi:predicted nuclease with TOPRIM domain